MSLILVLSTTNSEDLARTIASALVEAGEAACVNIVPGIRSIYRWENKIYDDREFLIFIKTTSERFEAVRKRIRQLHTYQLPEIIVLPIDDGDPDYLAWLKANCRL